MLNGTIAQRLLLIHLLNLMRVCVCARVCARAFARVLFSFFCISIVIIAFIQYLQYINFNSYYNNTPTCVWVSVLNNDIQ